MAVKLPPLTLPRSAPRPTPGAGNVDPPPTLDPRRTDDPPRERITIGGHSRMPTGRFWFLPYFDPGGHTTPAKREAFKVMMRDPTVKAGLLGKVLGVASEDWSVRPADPDNAAEQECAEFLRYCVDRLPMGMTGIAQTVLLHTLIDGYSASEKVREVEREDDRWHGKIVWQDLKSKPTHLWDPVVDNFGNVTQIQGIGVNSGHHWPVTEFVYARYLPLWGNPVGNSDLDAAYAAHWMQDTVTKLRALHAEKYVSPAMYGEYDNPADRPAVEDALANLQSRSWAAVPAGVKIQALNLAQQGEADFKSFIDDCQKQKLLALTGAYLQILESAANDPRGSSTTSKSTADLFKWLLAVMLMEIVSKQMFRELTLWNFPGVRPPRLLIGAVDEGVVGQILGNLQKLQALGYQLDADDVARRTSYQQAKDPAKALKPIAPTTPAAGGPPAGDPFRGAGPDDWFAQ